MRGLRVFGVVALVVIVCGGWHAGYDALRAYMRHTHAQSITPDHIVLASAPPWMSPAIKAQVKQTVARQVAPDPMNSRSLRIAAAALSRLPWVRNVVQIHRQPNGQILIRAQYRRPVAVIQCRDGYRLVGQHAVELLARPYYQNQLAQLGLPVMTGVASAPPPRAGQRWNDPDLLAGLNLLALLSHQPFFNQVQAVDISHHDTQGRLRLLIRTRDGGCIYWGFPPGREHSIEVGASVKIDRLRELARAYRGSIDADGQQVAIYGAAIELARPIIARQAAEDYHQR